MQKNWIGKSYGCEIDFKIEGSEKINSIKCYTTRPDTLFGFIFSTYLLTILYQNIMKIIKILNSLKKSVQKQEQQKSLLQTQQK